MPLQVQTLNTILLTTVECRGLRARLKDLSKKVNGPYTLVTSIHWRSYSDVLRDMQENQELFVSLYLSWCHNPVATFSLCLLGQTYKHAADLLHLLYAPRASPVAQDALHFSLIPCSRTGRIWR